MSPDAHLLHATLDTLAALCPQCSEASETATTDLAAPESSGHRPLVEQPDDFVDYLVSGVLPRT